MDEGFPLPKYDVYNHLKWMDEAGVETSVLTLAAPQPTSAQTVRQTNEAAARIKKEHPERFMFCAALPLPDVSKAIEEAKYALDVLKADGIKLATNVDGQYLGAPELDTLFSVLNERKAVVILHMGVCQGGYVTGLSPDTQKTLMPPATCHHRRFPQCLLQKAAIFVCIP